ncbi:hypothetical protein LSAT2_013714 [Lamellibrachia satsuma]|nr:hypothetical protein LSAT2_013714 [Lamellibrachia satsuma]
MNSACVPCIAGTRGSLRTIRNSFSHRMVTWYALVSCLVAATYAAAIEHPRRQYRSYEVLEVSVTPIDIDFYPGDTVTISCQVKGGVMAEDVPFISFYRQLGLYTIMPLSSASPGVIIRPGSVADYKDTRPVNKASKLLTLNIDAYDTMRDGVNYFYCKGWNRSGDSKIVHFAINKIPYYEI